MTLPSKAPDPGAEETRVGRAAGPWVGEPAPVPRLPLYLDVLRSRIWLIVLIVAVSVAAAATIVARTESVYRADADLLVTPIPRNSETLFGFGLVTESGDPTRDVETAAQLITTQRVAQRVRARLGLDESAQSLLGRVRAEPVAQSGIVTITADAANPRLAAQLANAFGQAAIAERTERLHALLDTTIPQFRRQLARVPARERAARESLAARLQALETLRLLPDPTLHFENAAVPPTSAVAPRPVLSIGAAFVAALSLAIGAVLGAHLLDTRVMREEELRRYRLPIIARIPREDRRERLGRRAPLWPDQLSDATADAFRRFASSLEAGIDRRANHTVFVTGAAPADGKTTVSINLATSLASLSDRVILIDADSRRPSLSRALGLAPSRGLTSVVTGNTKLEDAIEPAHGLASNVAVLAQEPTELLAPAPISYEAADSLIRWSSVLAHWVVCDGPALNYAPDALPIAKRAGIVLLVVRLGKTRARELSELGELLTQQSITPDGFVVIGGKHQLAY
jgi:Mrp family chromosome partitioning ATPase